MEGFPKNNLFLDLKNEKIAFCDSLSTLKKYGYAIENFSKTPLIMDRGLLEVDTMTTQGKLRCVLDTGCTWNVKNIKNEEKKTLQELVWNTDNFYETPILKIGNTNFGSSVFRCVPIEIPIHIEGILGMDFFLENVVFLDIINSVAYFAPSKTITSVEEP